MRVLIAEDHRISRFALQSLLEKWGFDVIAVDNGSEAWEILHDPEGPRMAILDWNMPGLTGMEVCRNVRADLQRDYLYLVLLTARGQKEDIAAGMEAGADDYITKPFDARELRARINAAQRILDLQDELLGAQESIRSRQDELAAIFNSAPTCMLLIDRKFQIRNANPAAAELSGQSLESMVGHRPGMALRCRTGGVAPGGCGTGEECVRCKLREILLDVVTTGTCHHRGETTLTVPDGSGGWKQLSLHVTSSPVTIGQEEMVLLCLEDISDRKMAERELEVLNQTLETQVEQRTREVKDLLKQKDQFVNQLGHDLKTPLTPLVALLPMAEKRSTDPKVLNILSVAINNVQFMRSLVEKTLSLARLNSSNVPFEVEEIDLMTETRSIVAGLSCVFQERGFHLHNQIVQPLFVRADRILLREVFHNLLTNAMKYSDGGGDLTIAGQAEPDGDVRIEIRDMGIGMSEEQLARAFQEFYKADESRHDRASAGLGLSICRAIIRKHGGRISAHSEGIGKGTTMRFVLPGARQDNPPGTENSGRQPTSIEAVDPGRPGSV